MAKARHLKANRLTRANFVSVFLPFKVHFLCRIVQPNLAHVRYGTRVGITCSTQTLYPGWHFWHKKRERIIRSKHPMSGLDKISPWQIGLALLPSASHTWHHMPILLKA